MELSNFGESSLVYDLRTYYANVLGVILTKLADAANSRKFQEWNELLFDLYINVCHKFSETEKKEWAEQVKKTIMMANKYPRTYTGQDKSAEAMHELKKAYGEQHTWLLKKMDKHNLFGQQYVSRGL